MNEEKSKDCVPAWTIDTDIPVFVIDTVTGEGFTVANNIYHPQWRPQW